MDKLYDAQKISRCLLDAVEQFNRYDKKARTFGTDHVLFVAEIHLINLIGSREDCCISDIAKAMRVTKGAASQMVKKLEKKGYLVKAGDLSNKARVIVHLTRKGCVAFEGHRRYHRDLDDKISSVVEKYDDRQREMICRFLQEVQEKWE